MRNLILYICQSLDGYIADISGKVHWLSEVEYTSEITSDYDEFYEKVDTLLMGSTTYKQVVNELSKDNWVYTGKEVFVFSNNQDLKDTRVSFIKKDTVSFVKNLKETSGKDIWLVGGAKLFNSLFEAGLIDKFIIFTLPIVLGSGISLFNKNTFKKLEILEVSKVSSCLKVVYKKSKE